MEIEKAAMYKISYGLFVLSVNDGVRDGGCIVNTVAMITDNPKRITVFVNKSNYTEEVIRKTGIFNASVISESADFGLFKRFGFASGRDTDKYEGTNYPRSSNGLKYVDVNTNAYISAKVIDCYDYGTHTLFVAEVTEAKVLSDEKSATYEYYFENIKPKPAAAKAEKKKWICEICGYVYEGESLPPDFVCPWCKHGADCFKEA